MISESSGRFFANSITEVELDLELFKTCEDPE
jgi:hypothetical protein